MHVSFCKTGSGCSSLLLREGPSDRMLLRAFLLLLLLLPAQQQPKQGTQDQRHLVRVGKCADVPYFAAATPASPVPPPREKALLNDPAAADARPGTRGLFDVAGAAAPPSQLASVTLKRARHLPQRDGLLAVVAGAPPAAKVEAILHGKTAAGETAAAAPAKAAALEQSAAATAGVRPENLSSTAASWRGMRNSQETTQEPLCDRTRLQEQQQQQLSHTVMLQQQWQPELSREDGEQGDVEDTPFICGTRVVAAGVYPRFSPSPLENSFPSASVRSPAETTAATGDRTVERSFAPTAQASDETRKAADENAEALNSRSSNTRSSTCGSRSWTSLRKCGNQSTTHPSSSSRENSDSVLHSNSNNRENSTGSGNTTERSSSPSHCSKTGGNSSSSDSARSHSHAQRMQTEGHTADSGSSSEESNTTSRAPPKDSAWSVDSEKVTACNEDGCESSTRGGGRGVEGSFSPRHQSSVDHGRGRSSTAGTSDRASSTEASTPGSLRSRRGRRRRLAGNHSSSRGSSHADGDSSGQGANGKIRTGERDGGAHGVDEGRVDNALLGSSSVEPGNGGGMNGLRRRRSSNSSGTGGEDEGSFKSLQDSFSSTLRGSQLRQSEVSSGTTGEKRFLLMTNWEGDIAAAAVASAVSEKPSRGEVAAGTLREKEAAEHPKAARPALSARPAPRNLPAAVSPRSSKGSNTVRHTDAIDPAAAASALPRSNKTAAPVSPSVSGTAAADAAGNSRAAAPAAVSGRDGVTAAYHGETSAASRTAPPAGSARAASSASVSPSSLSRPSSSLPRSFPSPPPSSPSLHSSPPASSPPTGGPATASSRSSSSSTSASASSQPASERDTNAANGWWLQWRRVWLIGVSVSIVLLAGVASGLTTGLMAFDELQLLVVQQTGAGPEKQQAEAVCDLIQRNRHQLLVTLLLCNALAMEALPLFLDRLVSPVLAVLLSVTAILFVGEIFPQALCTGRYQLAIAASLAPFVRLLLVLFWPAAYPISRLLDCWLSDREKPSLYARAHLKALIGLHQRDRQLPLLLQHRVEARRAQTQARRRSPSKKAPKGGEQEFVSLVGGAQGAAAAAGGTQGAPTAADVPAAARATGTASGNTGGVSAAELGNAGEQRAEEGVEKSSAATGDAGRPGFERWREAAGSGEQGHLAAAAAAASRAAANVTQETAYSGSGIEASAEDLEHAVGLHRDEVLIMQGALDMACKSVCDLMVPLKDVFMLEASVRLTRQVLIDILAKGHSRIPVYENRRENVRGVLLVKSLVLIDPGAGVRVADLMRGRSFRRLCTPLFVAPTINPYKLLNEFQEGRCHLAFVTCDVAAYQQAWEENTSVPAGTQLLGIVTLEDVIEELIQEEIMDEFDRRFRAYGSSSSLRGVDGQSSTNLCLRAAKVSSSEAVGGETHSEELYSLLQQPGRPPSPPTRELREPAEVAQAEDKGNRGNETGALASSGKDSAALSRFASLLLMGSQEVPLRGDVHEAVDRGRSATSILASSQLGSRASLLFASAPDVEGGRALDIALWGEPSGSSPGVRHVARRMQQQETRGRWRRKTAYFPISKNFAAGYRPALQHRNSSTEPSALGGIPRSATGVPTRLFERLLSASPPPAVPNHRRLTPAAVCATAAGAAVAASSQSGTQASDAQHLRRTPLSAAPECTAQEKTPNGSD